MGGCGTLGGCVALREGSPSLRWPAKVRTQLLLWLNSTTLVAGVRTRPRWTAMIHTGPYVAARTPCLTCLHCSREGVVPLDGCSGSPPPCLTPSATIGGAERRCSQPPASRHRLASMAWVYFPLPACRGSTVISTLAAQATRRRRDCGVARVAALVQKLTKRIRIQECTQFRSLRGASCASTASSWLWRRGGSTS